MCLSLVDIIKRKGILSSTGTSVRIPMMSISHSDLMPIRSERSDARLSQCEVVIDIRQEFLLFSLFLSLGNAPLFCGLCFLALTEGARRATGVSAKKHFAAPPPTPHLGHHARPSSSA